MNIQRDVEISRYQEPTFVTDGEKGDLYKAMRRYWGKREPFCNSFDASLFYNLGVMHGIRQERARRKHE